MDTESLKQQAYQATTDLANLTTSAPNLLSQLKQNLVSIFAKDNPLLQERNVLLSDYLSTPARARAEFLPTNLPEIEGRNLALSPTQQEAITTSRSAAALAPLAGINEVIKAMYGNIGEAVTGAGTIYDALIRGQQAGTTNLLNLYKAAVAEEESKRKNQGFGFDLSSILDAVRGSLGVETPKASDFYPQATQAKKTETKKEPGFFEKLFGAFRAPSISSSSLFPTEKRIGGVAGIPDVVTPLTQEELEEIPNLRISPSQVDQYFGGI